MCCVSPPQDHSFLPAGLLVLQRVPAVSGLCPQAESAAAAAPLHHLHRPPPGDLPEAAVGPTGTAQDPSQPVSRLSLIAGDVKMFRRSRRVVHTHVSAYRNPQERGMMGITGTEEVLGSHTHIPAITPKFVTQEILLIVKQSSSCCLHAVSTRL